MWKEFEKYSTNGSYVPGIGLISGERVFSKTNMVTKKLTF